MKQGLWVLLAAALIGCNRPAPVRLGIESLEASAPVDARLFVGVDVRQKTTMAQQAARLRQKPSLQQVANTLDRVASWSAPAGFCVVLPPTGATAALTLRKPPDIVLALAVTDEKAAEADLMQRQGVPRFTPTGIQGVSGWVSPDGRYAYVVHGGYLLLGTTSEAVGEVMETMSGQTPSLLDSPQLTQARRQVTDASPASLVWVAPGDSIQHGDIRYGVAVFSSEQEEMFLQVAPDRSSSVKALLKEPPDFKGLAADHPGLNALLAYVIESYSRPPGTVEVVPQGLHGAGRPVLTAVAALTASVLEPYLSRARTQAQLSACEANEKSLGTALERYSTEHQGHFPPSMRVLTPHYLRMLPTCPGASNDTYSGTYQVAPKLDQYTFFCRGSHHLSPDFPQYNSNQGLVTGD